MYRKLMFLISLVVLLGLTGSLWAAEITWDGGGADDSFCTALNWSTDTVPGPADEAFADSGKDILINCDVTVKDLRLPVQEGDSNQTLTMTSGNVTASSWQAVYEGDKVGIVNMTGGTITITGSGDSLRFTEDAGDDTYGYFNFGGTAVLSALNSTWRTGDNGGNVFIDVYDNAVVTIGGYSRIGDDGGGYYKFRGNCKASFLGWYEDDQTSLQMCCRDNGSDFYLQDNAEVYLAGALMCNKYSNQPGHVYVSGGMLNAGRVLLRSNAHMKMTGGRVIARTEMKVYSSADANLAAGIVEAGALNIDSGGLVNITGANKVAVIILNGNQTAAVAALVAANKLQGGGSKRLVAMDYNVTTPGKTTVWYDPTIDLCQTYAPIPANGATEVQSVITAVTLYWTRGDCTYTSTRDYVYFGTDYTRVFNATMSDAEFKAPPIVLLQPAQRLIGNLPLWKTYYWRIDETVTRNGVPGVLVKGNVWSFTTGCAAIVGDKNQDCQLNFIDFANIAGVWQESQMWPE